ncbi:Putative BTB/POZ domain-containing protein [Septoria linicola]|uniref:BTB/POZ domain-containing protein n=1 Tax=Septoria linicola TaxID=215465 RepID=A0A9Q9AWY5_9PEZI|nr:Putative BTB/POZ domain-containing protein [Septoria linicola]
MSDSETEGLLESEILLERVWKSEKWSDLKIKSRDGNVYSVHKVIVCERSTFFARACPGLLDVPLYIDEQADVLELMLRWLYALDESKLFKYCLDNSKAADLYEAAADYGIPTLTEQIEEQLDLGGDVYDRDLDEKLPPNFVKELIRHTTLSIGEIMADGELWSILQDYSGYQKAVITYLAKGSDKVEQDLFL